ncbi:phage major capsid protein [Mycobacterium sp. Aquia_216]|uniref:phage major capsid protein n=1 Tax=Mycobacterium sp. Aquia_216 TaxID=2991729 RepID=UPI00227BEEBE|nr:phage major capsid protein [Mycobacterium sp. Aquia_216]WAJ43128.1 phage major capsid protein [Mycobacterium sp. Aquia_216]
MPGLEQHYERLVKLRAEARAKRDAIVDRAERESRERLTIDETRAFERLTEQISGSAGFDERIGELAADIKRSGRGDPDAEQVRKATANPTGPGSTTLDQREGWAWGRAPRLDFDVEQLRATHERMRSGSEARLEQRLYSSAESDLPSQLYPWVIGAVHEDRLLDRIPTQLVEAPSVEYIVHQSTTGAPAVVAEGQPKPEVVMNYVPQIATLQKIAAHVGVTTEIIDDFSNFLGYTQTELYHEVIDVENLNLISGPGGTGAVQGLLNTSGTLTHVAGQGSTPFTPLDDVEIAIAQLRAGPAPAEADLFIVHPDTFSALRRTKDLYGRYLLSADPAVAEADNIWGVPVLQTTQIAAGSGILLDTSKFGRAIVRGPITIFIGWANDDFTRNIRRFVCEERVQLAVNRPAAVNIISGLPATP